MLSGSSSLQDQEWVSGLRHGASSVASAHSVVLVAIEWHDCDNLVLVTDSRDEVRDVRGAPAGRVEAREC